MVSQTYTGPRPHDTRDLRQRRAKLFEECRSILNKADEEKRSLTGDEDTAYRRKFEEARSLALDIEDKEHDTALAKEETRRRMRPDEHKQATAPGRGCFVFTNSNGEEYRTIRPDESYRSAIGLDDAEFKIAHPVGRVIRARITGDWSRLPEEHRATYAQTPGASGGLALTPAMSGYLIDKARAQSVIVQAGGLTLPIPDNASEIRLLKVETDPTAQITAPAQAIPKSEGTFGAIILTAKTIAIYCEGNLELFRDASNLEGIIEETISKAIALKFDALCLNYTGASGPSGLLYSSDVTTRDVAGPITYDKMLDGLNDLWGENVEAAVMIGHPDVRLKIAKLKDGEGQYQPPPPELADLKRLWSTQVESQDANDVLYMGDLTNHITAIRSDVEIEVSGTAGSLFRDKKIGIRGLFRGDAAPGRSGDIVRLYGIT